MSKKRKRDKQRQRQAQAAQTDAPLDEAAAQAAAERRAQQKREWAERKKARERKPAPIGMYAWAGGGAAVLIAVVVGAVLLLSGGGSSEGGAVATATPDPRVAGLPIAQTVEIDAGDSGQATGTYFDPNTVSGRAGEVIEFVVKNVGSVAHNLRVSGEDHEYDTRDDFLTDPGTIQPGQEARVLVKIDTPGTYEFHCDFHPLTQIGNLIISG